MNRFEKHLANLRKVMPDFQVSLHSQFPSVKSMKNNAVERELKASEFDYYGYKRHVVSMEDVDTEILCIDEDELDPEGVSVLVDFTLQFAQYHGIRRFPLAIIAVWAGDTCVHFLAVNDFEIFEGVSPQVSDMEFNLHMPTIIQLLKDEKKKKKAKLN